MFPEAPGANGHPPSPHKELSNLKSPILIPQLH